MTNYAKSCANCRQKILIIRKKNGKPKTKQNKNKIIKKETMFIHDFDEIQNRTENKHFGFGNVDSSEPIRQWSMENIIVELNAMDWIPMKTIGLRIEKRQ